MQATRIHRALLILSAWQYEKSIWISNSSSWSNLRIYNHKQFTTQEHLNSTSLSHLNHIQRNTCQNQWLLQHHQDTDHSHQILVTTHHQEHHQPVHQDFHRPEWLAQFNSRHLKVHAMPSLMKKKSWEHSTSMSRTAIHAMKSWLQIIHQHHFVRKVTAMLLICNHTFTAKVASHTLRLIRNTREKWQESLSHQITDMWFHCFKLSAQDIQLNHLLDDLVWFFINRYHHHNHLKEDEKDQPLLYQSINTQPRHEHQEMVNDIMKIEDRGNHDIGVVYTMKTNNEDIDKNQKSFAFDRNASTLSSRYGLTVREMPTIPVYDFWFFDHFGHFDSCMIPLILARRLGRIW